MADTQDEVIIPTLIARAVTIASEKSLEDSGRGVLRLAMILSAFLEEESDLGPLEAAGVS